MDFDNLFDKYRIVKDNYDVLFTIVIYDMQVCDILENLGHKMELAKTIKNPKKKSMVCGRLYNLQEHLKEYKQDKQICCVILVGEEIDEIDMNKKWVGLLRHYGVDRMNFKYDVVFDIDYVKDLLTNDEFRNVIHVKNNTLTHIHLNINKRRIHHQEETKSMNIENYIKECGIKDKCLVHGVSGAIKTVKSDYHFIYGKSLSDDEINRVFENDVVKGIHKVLEDYMDFIKNEKTMNRIILGKDLNKKIMNMELEYLFCSPDMHIKIMEKIPMEYLNFKIIKVNSLEYGDVGSILKTSYSGLLGVTYF